MISYTWPVARCFHLDHDEDGPVTALRLPRCHAAMARAAAPVTAAKVVTAVNNVVATARTPMPITGNETPRYMQT